MDLLSWPNFYFFPKMYISEVKHEHSKLKDHSKEIDASYNPCLPGSLTAN